MLYFHELAGKKVIGHLEAGFGAAKSARSVGTFCLLPFCPPCLLVAIVALECLLVICFNLFESSD